MNTGFPAVPVSRLALCEANCKKPVYTMHKWWARRLGVIFRMLLVGEGIKESPSRGERWSRFYSPHRLPEGFTVLDPFLGGGTSLVEAAKLGANCVGVDIDPVACFVTEQELRGAEPMKILDAFEGIKAAVGEELASLYRSKVGKRCVDVVYFFWVDAITCSKCGNIHDGHPTLQLAHSVPENRQTVVCPHCNSLKAINLGFQSFTCDGCRTRVFLEDVPISQGVFTCPSCNSQDKLYHLYTKGLVTPRLFAKEYLTNGKERGFAAINDADLALYECANHKLRDNLSALPIPQSPIPSRDRFDRRPLLYGYKSYRELFNSRQLYCLGLLGREISKLSDLSVKKSLALAFSHCLATNNMFCGYAFGYRRLTPLFSIHAFRKISRPVEGNVLGLSIGRGSFTNCVRGVVEGCEYMMQPYEFRYGRRADPDKVPVGTNAQGDSEAHNTAPQTITILNRSSTHLAGLKDGSVDLILSDPPYFDNLPYSELSDFYHVWLREVLNDAYVGKRAAHTPMHGSLFAGRRRGDAGKTKVIETYTETLTEVFRECHRVAKERARFIFTFHHRDPQAWNALGSALLGSGFRALQVFPVRSEGRSGLHSYSGTIKWDSVFVCEKNCVTELKIPKRKHALATVQAAWRNSGKWSSRIRKSGMDFGWADRGSLAMSITLERFSARDWSASQLQDALLLIEAQVKRRTAHQLESSYGAEE